MPVDTAVDRRSALVAASGLEWLEDLPLPDGLVGVSDRATLLGFYGGLPVVEPPVVVECSDRHAGAACGAAGDRHDGAECDEPGDRHGGLVCVGGSDRHAGV